MQIGFDSERTNSRRHRHCHRLELSCRRVPRTQRAEAGDWGGYRAAGWEMKLRAARTWEEQFNLYHNFYVILLNL